MPISKLKQYLDENHVGYITISHSKAYTAQEIASMAHIPGKEFAKTVIIKINERMAMAVLPASYKVDFNMLADLLGVKKVSLASEKEFAATFPECETGAMPPFGNLYGMDVYVAESLMEDDQITFNACSHTELMRVKIKDFGRLVNPKVLKFSFKTVY